ncbi:MAG: FkbM family methyltransferase, partial [Bacteroidota bacterium]
MKLASVLTVLTALLLRKVPSPFWRFRQRFYLSVKNSGLVLSSRLRHSNIQVPLDIGDWVQYWMYMDGAYEREMVDYLEPEVRGRVFLDIGANVGNYTLTLCRSAKHIYAFEASKKNVEILTRAVGLVGNINNVTILHNAVSSTSDEIVRLFLSEDASGNHSQFLGDTGRSENVATLSLDDFVLRFDAEEIAVIKMDIEGAEFLAIEGGKRL